MVRCRMHLRSFVLQEVEPVWVFLIVRITEAVAMHVVLVPVNTSQEAGVARPADGRILYPCFHRVGAVLHHHVDGRGVCRSDDIGPPTV